MVSERAWGVSEEEVFSPSAMVRLGCFSRLAPPVRSVPFPFRRLFFSRNFFFIHSLEDGEKGGKKETA